MTSLSALLRPEVVERIIGAYWSKNGAEPKGYTIDLAWRLHAATRETNGPREPESQQLGDFCATIGEYRHGGLTEKNLAVIRQALAGSIWTEVVRLPDRLMAEDRLPKRRGLLRRRVTSDLAGGRTWA